MFGEKLFLSPPSYKRCFYPSFHTSQSTELAIFNWIPCFLMLRGWDKASKRMCLSVCQYILEVILSSLYDLFSNVLIKSTFSIDDMPNKMGGSWESPPCFSFWIFHRNKKRSYVMLFLSAFIQADPIWKHILCV